MSKILLIVGPTGIGKTKLSIILAKKYNAEIINTDKMAMYKETNIGTAKIKKEEMDGIKHHFISNISLLDNYSIYDYQNEARKTLNNLIANNKNIIIVGGSGLYTKSLLYDYKLEKENKVDKEFDDKTNEELKSIADSISNNDIHKNNRKRLIRFINKSNNQILDTNNKDIPLYTFITVGLRTDRDNLYNLLNNRVDKMIKNGLIEEAKELYNKNYDNLKYIIGYKELYAYFKNQKSLDEVIEEIKKNTRHYAKRQYTWFYNQMKDIKWFDVDINNFDNTVNEINNYLDSM